MFVFSHSLHPNRTVQKSGIPHGTQAFEIRGADIGAASGAAYGDGTGAFVNGTGCNHDQREAVLPIPRRNTGERRGTLSRRRRLNVVRPAPTSVPAWSDGRRELRAELL
jgi:hypothetical protein